MGWNWLAAVSPAVAVLQAGGFGAGPAAAANIVNPTSSAVSGSSIGSSATGIALLLVVVVIIALVMYMLWKYSQKHGGSMNIFKSSPEY
jgi:heme/copper-type cytochrome/quinol oxidase subunit 2